MAATRRNNFNQNTRRYRTYGSVAYQPEFEQEPVRAPSRRTAAAPARRPEPVRRPQIQPRRRQATRPDVQVRTQTAVSLVAVVGFFAVLACALLLVISSAQLAMVNNDIVDLRATLSDLQDEGQTLQARYELEFDLEAIEQEFLSNGSMVRASVGQTVYLDLSGGDSVVYYEGSENGLSALFQRGERFLAGLLS